MWFEHDFSDDGVGPAGGDLRKIEQHAAPDVEAHQAVEDARGPLHADVGAEWAAELPGRGDDAPGPVVLDQLQHYEPGSYPRAGAGGELIEANRSRHGGLLRDRDRRLGVALRHDRDAPLLHVQY